MTFVYHFVCRLYLKYKCVGSGKHLAMTFCYFLFILFISSQIRELVELDPEEHRELLKV